MRKMLFQKECLHLTSMALVVTSLLLNGCKSRDSQTPRDYTMDKPQRMELGKALNEISGIYFKNDDSSLLAVADSKEKIFQINLKTKKLKDYTEKVVASDSDLEDIVKVDTAIFLLSSKGVLFEVPEKATDTSGVKIYDSGVSGSNDFETLYYDPSANGLIMLCKTCGREKGTGVRTAFRFDLRTRSFDSSALFTISRGEIKTLLKNADAKFEPSAAAIHPVNKRLYILSSAGHLLVITDTRGQVAEAYDLNPDIFPQAEGIAFAPNGDMYITNEGKYGKPTLLLFRYQQKGKKR
ncbi:MAG TPA: SdiA-regulated domain-containing protein [Flavisolibacter sp.]|nr:SdiA-regulated domain-containing protein [Flavisolibacter sp.]